MLRLLNKKFSIAIPKKSICMFRNFSSVIPFNLADIGEGIAEVELLKWHIKPGDKVNEFDPICEVQSDKASVEISSRYTGIVKELKWEEGDIAKVGMPLINIEISSDSSKENSSQDVKVKACVESSKVNYSEDEVLSNKIEHEKSNDNSNNLDNLAEYENNVIEDENDNYNNDEKKHGYKKNSKNSNKKVEATPAVRRLTRDHGLDILNIKGSGKNGRVLKGDVLTYVEDIHKNKTIASNSNMTAIQRAMFDSMEQSLKIPHFHYMEKYDFSTMIKYRDAMKEFTGSRLTFMPFIIKALSLSLNHYPIINATLYEDKKCIEYNNSHNIGIAVDTTHGLFVPVIKDVQDKNIIEISECMEELINKGKNNKYKKEDLNGNNITLSNIGSIGNCSYATPIIPPGTVSIGAIGRMDKENKSINISWAADHRIIDGATMAKFSNKFHDYLRNPLSN